MIKIHTSLTLVLLLVSATVFQLVTVMPKPVPTEVLSGQVGVLVPNNLTNPQRDILNRAYAQAVADGHKDPGVVQGVILQESRAGGIASYKVAGNKGDEYYGLGQLKVSAVRSVMQMWPALWAKYQFQTRTDDELKANLILNTDFNIEMTSKYLKLLQTNYGFQGRELMNAYNRGPGGVKLVDSSSFHYAIGAEQKLAAFKRQGKI